MPKLRLDVSNLEVQSFSITAPAEERGTVHGLSGPPRCDWTTLCPSMFTDCNTWNDPTCGEVNPSCDPSCDPRYPCCATDGAFSCPA